MKLVDFLSVRISEDEDAARGLLRRAQEHELDCGEPQLLGKRIPGWYDWPRVQQMSARVLAECQAKRRIVSLFSPTLADEMRAAAGEYDETAFRGGETLRALALPYADHPDYREEWKP